MLIETLAIDLITLGDQAIVVINIGSHAIDLIDLTESIKSVYYV